MNCNPINKWSFLFKKMEFEFSNHFLMNIFPILIRSSDKIMKNLIIFGRMGSWRVFINFSPKNKFFISVGIFKEFFIIFIILKENFLIKNIFNKKIRNIFVSLPQKSIFLANFLKKLGPANSRHLLVNIKHCRRSNIYIYI